MPLSARLPIAQTRFETLTVKGELQVKAKRLVDYLVDIVLADLGVSTDANNRILPYLKSQPRGVAPN